MDLTSVFMPGAQSLVTAILTDSWHQARTAVAKLWARRGGDARAIEQAGRELDAARGQALALAGTGTEAERAERMELFWAGYLAGQAAARPDLATAFAELPALLNPRASQAAQAPLVQNNVNGPTNNVVQAGHITNFTIQR